MNNLSRVFPYIFTILLIYLITGCTVYKQLHVTSEPTSVRVSRSGGIIGTTPIDLSVGAGDILFCTPWYWSFYLEAESPYPGYPTMQKYIDPCHIADNSTIYFDFRHPIKAGEPIIPPISVNKTGTGIIIDESVEVDVDNLTGFSQKSDSQKWGFIIAIEQYPNFPSADYAESDARLIKEYYIKILGVPEENIIYLSGSDATKSKIKGYLKSYLPKNVSEETILYVYYGGHGIPFPGQEKVEPYLVPYDSDTVTITETGYRLEDFYGDIDHLNIKQAFIFLDSCFSGIASRGDRMLIAGGRPIVISIENRAFLSGKLISFTSSSGGEMSSAYPEKRHGLFTYFLLRGLRGEADTDQSGTIRAGELYDYVKANVNKLSRRNGIEQTPEIAPPINTVRDIEINKVINNATAIPLSNRGKKDLK